MGLDFDQLYPGKFMKAGEFQGRDLTLIISDVKLEELGDGKEAETKVVVSFANTKKKLVMNKTNATCLKLMFGRNTDDWLKKKVTFYPAPIRDPFTGEDTIAIRVRGSPEIPQTMECQATLGRKAVKFKLYKTGQPQPNGKKPVQAVPPPPPEPPLQDEPGMDADPLTGEVPFGEEAL